MWLVCNNFEVCYVFQCNYGLTGVEKSGCGVVGVCFTDLLLHSSMNYHQELTT
jgi:hypothetical protein